MSDPAPDPRRFYTETIPSHYNRAVDAQSARGVDATIRVDVRGEGGGTFFLNVEGGRMTAGDAPVREPFLTVIQEPASFARLAREAGDSALALLGGLSGLGGELVLTRTRLELFGALRGLVRFEVAGEDGFSLLTHFGPDPVPDEPRTSIRVDAAAYDELRSGALDAPSAFLEGRIDVRGDMQLAMQLALATTAGD